MVAVRNASGGEAANISRRVCALAAVTVAAESACARLWLKQVSEAGKLVSANGQVRGCPAGKCRRRRYPVKVITSGKLGQLSCLVSNFSQQSSKQEAAAVSTRGSKGLLPGQAGL